MFRLMAMAGLVAAGIFRMSGAQSEGLDTAVIVDSGSTNRPGFRITIDRAGNADVVSMAKTGPAKPQRRTLSPAMQKRFEADLAAARPLPSLPAVHCMKSVSFGSTLTLIFGGEQTPDLSCGDGGNAAMGNLIRDVNEIVALFQ
jgi:hypothetical protein